MASNPALKRLDKVVAMQTEVLDAAIAIRVLENFVYRLDEMQRVHLLAVRKRILYYIVYFEYETWSLMGFDKPAIEDLKALYTNASYEDWKMALQATEDSWLKPLLPEDAFQYHPN
ncbi:hypothetical protein [Sediminibacterium sp.]|uniref:hypothetical protein n=1 Tax=Sediminibacterium sp. TaxID=1917865 RepID=UPI003F695A77